MLRPTGVVGMGSTPIALVGSVALLIILLRYISVNVILLANSNSEKEVPMAKTLTVRTCVLLSSIFETMWAIGVGGVVGHLSA